MKVQIKIYHFSSVNIQLFVEVHGQGLYLNLYHCLRPSGTRTEQCFDLS